MAAEPAPPNHRPTPPGAPRRAAVVLAFVVMTLVWGTTWSAIRIGLAGIPPFAGVSLRFALAAAVLMAAARWRGVSLRGGRREWALWIALAILSFSLPYGIVYWAEQWVPSGLTAILFAAFPLLVALIAHVALPGERLTLRGGLGTFVGFGGVALLFSEDFGRLGGSRVLVASVVVLLAPLSSALAYVATKRWGGGLHPFALTVVPMGLTAILMGSASLVWERGRPFDFAPAPVAALLYLALAGTALTFTLFYWLLSILPATRLSFVAYLVPVVAVLVGVVVLDEPITLRIALGAGLVLAGVAAASVGGTRRVAVEPEAGSAA